MKKTLVMVLAIVLALAMVACAAPAAEAPAAEAPAAEAPAAEAPAAEAPAEAPAAEGLKFALSVPTLDNEYFIEVARGAQEFCDENGIELILPGGGSYDAAAQYAEFENFITMGVNGVICCPVDEKSVSEITTECQANGMYVIGQAQAISTADGNSVVDDYAYGVNNGTCAAEWINTYLADAEKVEVCLVTLDHQEQVKLRGDGMEDTIKELCPNAEIVYRQKAESSEEAMMVAETALQAHPDIKVFACVNDQMALGVWQAVQNLKKEADDLYIGGGDYTSQIKDLVADPTCCVRQSTDIGPAASGRECAQMLYDIIVNGKEGETKFFQFTPMWQPDTL